ncbi:unnamed protein product [Effrenium voratum]|nr:unnamed protein product [Effrenium voratum]
MKQKLEKMMAACAEEAAALLTLASSLGQVVILTLSRQDWVADSCRHFCPSLQECISALGVRVVHAQRRPRSSGEALSAYSSRLKSEAICQLQGTWRSVVSIGDSDFERLGTRMAAQELKKRQDGQHVTTKTLKTMEKPTTEELTTQLRQITTWLPNIVLAPGDLDVQLLDVEDHHIKALDELLRRK